MALKDWELAEWTQSSLSEEQKRNYKVYYNSKNDNFLAVGRWEDGKRDFGVVLKSPHGVGDDQNKNPITTHELYGCGSEICKGVDGEELKMALKDWELISVTDNSSVWDDVKSHGRKKRVYVTKYPNGWEVLIIESPEKELRKLIKSEKSALNYAKDYMRKH